MVPRASLSDWIRSRVPSDFAFISEATVRRVRSGPSGSTTASTATRIPSVPPAIATVLGAAPSGRSKRSTAITTSRIRPRSLARPDQRVPWTTGPSGVRDSPWARRPIMPSQRSKSVTAASTRSAGAAMSSVATKRIACLR